MKALNPAVLFLLLIAQTLSAQPINRFRSNNEPADTAGVLSPAQQEKLSKANPEDITNENFPERIESFDFPKAELQDVVNAISRLTKQNFIIEPGLRGQITIVAPTSITVAEAYKAFLSALAINGFTVVKSGAFWKIKNARQALRDSVETYSGPYFPNSDQMITRIVHFKYINAKDVHNYLRNLSTQHGEMQPYEATNSLIISDFGSNIERLMKIIAELDKPGFEERVVVIPVRYAKAKDLSQIIDQIINKGDKRNDPSRISRFRSTPPGGSSGGTTESLSLVAPDDRTNALIVVGNEAGIEKIKELVKTLDYRLSPDEAGGVYVYYVKHVDAEKLANTLQGIAQDSSQKQQQKTSAPTGGFPPPISPTGGATSGKTEPIFGGDVKIVADKNTNSLIVTASKLDYEVVKNLLGQIDIPKDQVYIEAVIMEMNVGGKKDWGITYYKFKGDKDGNVVARAGFNSNAITDILTPNKEAVFGFGTGEILQLSNGTTKIPITSLAGFIKFIQTYNEGNVLSTPQISALDNEEAEIEVGDEVPVGSTRDVVGNNVSETPQFKKATTRLKIKPFISRTDDTIRLEVDQSIKSVSTAQIQAENLAKSTQALTERSIKTNIIVRDGDTAVLGGLMRDSETIQETKVPILGDIPIIGWLFKGSTRGSEKLNLLVFLTPRTVRNMHDAQQVFDKKVSQRIDFIQKNMKGKDPHGYYLDALPRKRAEVKPKGIEERNSDSDLVEETLQTF